jgi:hypothetical protein
MLLSIFLYALLALFLGLIVLGFMSGLLLLWSVVQWAWGLILRAAPSLWPALRSALGVLVFLTILRGRR